MVLGRGSSVVAAARSCLGRDRSLLLRAYTVVGLSLAVLTGVLIALALPTWIARTGGTSATLMLGQGLLVLAGLAVIAGFVLPILLAHRRLPDPGTAVARERAYGLLGGGYIVAIYLALLVSAPPEAREAPSGPLAPAIEVAYGLDPVYGVVPPLAVVVLVIALDRRFAG